MATSERRTPDTAFDGAARARGLCGKGDAREDHTGKACGNESSRGPARGHCRGGDGPAGVAEEGARQGEGWRDQRRDDGGVQGPRGRSPDAARERDSARPGVGHRAVEAPREDRGTAAGLREDRLRREHARPAAGSARRLVRPAFEGGRRRLHQDPPLLQLRSTPGRSTITNTRGSSASATSASPTTSPSFSSWSVTRTAPTKRAWSMRRRSRAS